MAKSKTAAKTSAKKASASKSPKKKSTKPAKPSEAEATIDRRRTPRRKEQEAEASDPTPQLERRKKVSRRRQIDPTTCERDYSEAEVEFMNALDDYKRTSGRMFPTCSEVLEVIRGLGYVQLSAAEAAAHRGDTPESGDQEQQALQEALDAQAESEGLHVDAAEEQPSLA